MHTCAPEAASTPAKTRLVAPGTVSALGTSVTEEARVVRGETATEAVAAMLAVRAATAPHLRPSAWSLAIPAEALRVTEEMLRDAERMADESGADLAAYLVGCMEV